MQIYVGYGFDTADISNESWAALVKKYDSYAYDEIKKAVLTDDEEVRLILNSNKLIEEYALDFIDENSMSRAEYLSRIINGEESKSAGTDYIVSTYDDFLVFDNVRFANDSKRTQYIKTQEDFIDMIGKYVPVNEIYFGNLYEGNEWIDPCFFLE